MSDIINEIQHDIADEKYTRIFTEHGKKLIVAAVAVILLTAGLTAYKKNSEKRSRESGTLFVNAFDNANPAEYDAIISKGQKGYAPMAAIIKASLQNSAGKPQDAIKTLDKVINNISHDAAFREKAQLDKAFIMIDQKADKTATLSLLNDLITEKSIFRTTALELKASYLLQTGDKKQALAIFEELARNEQIPATAQERAKHILATINE